MVSLVASLSVLGVEHCVRLGAAPPQQQWEQQRRLLRVKRDRTRLTVSSFNPRKLPISARVIRSTNSLVE